MAPHVIEGPRQERAAGVEAEEVFLKRTHEHGAADGTCAARMTSVNVPERVNEPSGG